MLVHACHVAKRAAVDSLWGRSLTVKFDSTMGVRSQRVTGLLSSSVCEELARVDLAACGLCMDFHATCAHFDACHPVM